jgi:Uma2 family endonuclease
MTTLSTQDPLATLPDPLAVEGGGVAVEEAEELPPMSTYALVIASLLVTHLNAFARPRRLGIAVGEVFFGLRPRSKKKHRPDVSFVSSAQWPLEKPWPHTDPWPVVPEIAVEAISPNDLAEEVMGKVKEYLEAGVRLVWVIYPKLGWVHVYESLARMRGLTVADRLDAGEVLPGFTLPLRELFPHVSESPAEAEANSD